MGEYDSMFRMAFLIYGGAALVVVLLIAASAFGFGYWWHG